VIDGKRPGRRAACGSALTAGRAEGRPDGAGALSPPVDDRAGPSRPRAFPVNRGSRRACASSGWLHPRRRASERHGPVTQY
jgi:hypothetical protein